MQYEWNVLAFEPKHFPKRSASDSLCTPFPLRAYPQATGNLGCRIEDLVFRFISDRDAIWNFPNISCPRDRSERRDKSLTALVL